MDVASEFLRWRRRLCALKKMFRCCRKRKRKRQLKQELTGQLLEYQQCKEAAMRLRERFRSTASCVRRRIFPQISPISAIISRRSLLRRICRMLGEKEAAGAAKAGGHHLKAHHAPCGLRGFANCFRAAQPVEKAACVVKRAVPRQKRPLGACGGVPRRFGACQGQAIARGR